MLLPGLDRRTTGSRPERSHSDAHQYPSHRHRYWHFEHLYAHQQPDTDHLDRNRLAHSHGNSYTHHNKHSLPAIDIHIHLHTNCDGYSYLYTDIYPFGDANVYFNGDPKQYTHQNQHTNKHSHFSLSDEHCHIYTAIINSLVIPIS